VKRKQDLIMQKATSSVKHEFTRHHAMPASTINAPPGYNLNMQNLLHNLNPEQLAAVTLPAQPALILAGAGSGKTRVLTTRIAWLIQTGQVSPAGVLAVTFTNKGILWGN
jgi:DNA helicase-2/ATP-dependent DNA helicase PcrA